MHSIATTGLLYDDLGRIVGEHDERPTGATPRISIVTPSYNQGEYLEECLVSLLGQNYPNLELIVIDGGSTDDSVSIIKRYAKYLAYWQSCPDRGQYDAIQQGLGRATGEIQGWLNSDDKHHPGSLATLAQVFTRHQDIDWLTGRPSVWNSKGQLQETHPLQIWHRERYLEDSPLFFIQQESTFWRRRLWQQAGARIATELRYAGDFELWLRYFRHARLYTLDRLLGGFRVHSAQKTASGMPAYRAEVAAVVTAERKLPVRPPSAVSAFPPSSATTDEPGLEVITSLDPDDLSRQKPAISSWLTAGARVVSVNVEEDIARLRPHFPTAVFRPSRGQRSESPTAISLDELVGHAAASRCRAAAIIFPDVILRGGPEQLAALARLAATDPLLSNSPRILAERAVEGCRIDLFVDPERARSPHSNRRFPDTYDGVFATPAFFAEVPRSSLVFGRPWSDYWIPLHAVKTGRRLSLLNRGCTARLLAGKQLAPSDDHARLAALLDPHTVAVLRRFDELYSKSGERPANYAPPLVEADLAAHRIRRAVRQVDLSQSCSPFNEATRRRDERQPIRVSAIVSTYRSAAHIGNCLADLLNQTIAQHVEIIVIDAASPEHEGDIVRDYQQRHPNIRYLRTPERIGVYAAWNLAIRQARGAYVISCSTNDRLRPDALQRLSDYLDEQPLCALAFGNSYLVQDAQPDCDHFTPTGAYCWSRTQHTDLLRAAGVGPHPMWRRELHDELGYFDESFAAIADQDFWLRITQRYAIAHLDEFTGLYLVDPASLSGDQSRASGEIRLIHERHARPFSYRIWQLQHVLTRQQAEQYERRMRSWQKQPEFLVGIVHEGADLAPLVATIQNLAGGFYDRTSIAVFSAAEAPASFGGERLRWCRTPRPSIADAWHHVAGAEWLPKPDWVIGLRAGDHLTPHAALMLAEAAHRHPEWQAIYADEDRQAADGERSAPRFKPDLDLTLLRNQPYLGTLALSRSAIEAFAREGFFDSPAVEYDLALRLLERHGRGCIGHLPEVLFHRAPANDDGALTEAHVAALQAHCARLGVNGEIGAGLSEQGIRISYRHAAQPSVSVLLACPPDASAIERYLSSFLEHTQYPHWEILLIPPPDRAPVAAFLDGIAALGDARLRVLPAVPGTPLAALARAVGECRGDYLLFADAGTAIVHADWLQNLLDHAQRPEIGAVGARLVFADGQIDSAAPVFGFLGVQGSPYRGFPMSHPGYLGHLLLDQEHTVLDPRCLLVSRSALAALGDFDAGYVSIEAALVDVCLRLGEKGCRLVWTPYATLLSQGSAKAQEAADLAAVESVPAPAADEERLFRHWLPRFPADPAHNPNLSRVHRGANVEPEGVLNWRPTAWKPLPRVLGSAADYVGCGYYRIIDPMTALVQGGRVDGYVGSRGLTPAEIAQAELDTVVFQRQYKDEQIRLIENYRRYSPALRVYELDDLMTCLPEKSVYRAGLPADIEKRLRQAVALCDRLVVSTQPLAEAYGNFGAPAVVVPNFLAKARWSNLPERQRGQRNGRPRVGWSGALGHAGDLDLVLPVIKALAGEVDWILMGDCTPAIRPYLTEFHPYVPIEEYPAKLASLNLDLALAPLEINSFNEAKSHLKILEYGILGYPVICTDILPYQGGFPVTRLPNIPAVWIREIRARVHDLAAARGEGARLRKHVARHWLLEDHLDAWTAAWLP